MEISPPGRDVLGGATLGKRQVSPICISIDPPHCGRRRSRLLPRTCGRCPPNDCRTGAIAVVGRDADWKSEGRECDASLRRPPKTDPPAITDCATGGNGDVAIFLTWGLRQDQCDRPEGAAHMRAHSPQTPPTRLKNDGSRAFGLWSGKNLDTCTISGPATGPIYLGRSNARTETGK